MIRYLIVAAVCALIAAPVISLDYACAIVAQAPLPQAGDLQLISLSPMLPGSLF